MGDDQLQTVGREIRRLRQAAGLSGVELARRAGVPQPTVSRVETGQRVSDVEVVIGLLVALDAERAESDRLSSLAREAYAASSGPRVDAGVSFRRGSALELARLAGLVRSFESVVIPDLLRTSGYAAAALPGSASGSAERSAVLAESGRRFTFLLTEGALRTWPGSPDCMPEQLARLLEVDQTPNVSVGVVPASVAVTSDRWAVPLHGFTLYDDAAVTVEMFTRELTLTGEHDVRVYAEVFEGFARAAVFGDRARELVEQVRRDFRKLLGSIH